MLWSKSMLNSDLTRWLHEMQHRTSKRDGLIFPTKGFSGMRDRDDGTTKQTKRTKREP
jgi:hypothetical protein